MRLNADSNDLAWTECPPRGLNLIATAGKIQMMGLDPIKARLGSKWERMSEHVHRYFEAAIRLELGPGDTFSHDGPSTYLLLFRGLSVAEAQLKCRAIAEDVCRKLFGEEEDVSVRALTLMVDQHDLGSPHGRTQLSELLERDGHESTFRQSGPAKEGKWISVRFKDCPHETHNLSLTTPNIIYRPLWDTARGAILVYVCQPLAHSMAESCKIPGMCAAIGSSPESEEREQLQLDMTLLRECARRSAILRDTGNRALLLSPLHLTTLSRPKLWKQYSELRNSLPALSVADIGFVVHGIGPAIPNIRLAAELPKLSVISRHVYCLTDDPQGVCQQFRNTGARAVGVALNYDDKLSVSNVQLDVLGREARAGGLDAFALGVAERSPAVNAIGFGIRWLEGPAISPPIADPKFSFVQRIETLYRAELAAARTHGIGERHDVG